MVLTSSTARAGDAGDVRPASGGRLVLAAVLAGIPVAFGVVRAIQTGRDLRYFVTAMVSLIAASATDRVAAARRPSGASRVAVTFAVATVASAVAAFALGARSMGAIWMVTAGFSVCTTASAVLRGRRSGR